MYVLQNKYEYYFRYPGRLVQGSGKALWKDWKRFPEH